ncbi:DctP family TRAP transporter solute-binding subunit [Cupriavidus numazuensis]|uniref:C4-dicarboxylate ABC transporter substrate-binding protein n=1 Tax=Cupriavidus numazuensis TaxID=221992 RepID=A0ABN7Q1K2_9BURK|nr:DctP family TRAP transporter solute-binding subunit [Cupriavidus numazuensis]CAG2153162.1 hypothetical protein LMG26411_04343 [Cupriavidus numazuensis]
MQTSRRRFVTLMAGATAGLWGTSARAQRVIKYAHFQPAKTDQPNHAAALAFKEHVEKASNGSLKVDIYPAGQLGSAQQTAEGVRLGSIELAVLHEGAITGIYKTFNIFGIPYLFESHQQAYTVLDGQFGKDLAEDMRKKTGVRLLSYADNGVRHFTNSKRIIKSPADLRGLKIRVQPSPVYIEFVKALGASPSAIDWGELPAALAQGTADGQENSVSTILAASLYQQQKYATLDGHIYGQFGYLANDRFFNGLSSSERVIVQEGVDRATKIHRDMTRALDLGAQKVLSDKGMSVTTLTGAEIDAFRKAAQPAVRSYLETNISRDWTNRLIATAQSARSQG